MTAPPMLAKKAQVSLRGVLQFQVRHLVCEYRVHLALGQVLEQIIGQQDAVARSREGVGDAAFCRG